MKHRFTGTGGDGGKAKRDKKTRYLEEAIEAGHDRMSPLKAIRLRCIDCCAGQMNEVALCPAKACPSWAFRHGVNPWHGNDARGKLAKKDGAV